MQASDYSSRLTLVDLEGFFHFALRIATASIGLLLLTVAMLATPTATYAGASFGVFVSIAPPPLPDVCAANLPWSRLHLDAGLLGLGPG